MIVLTVDGGGGESHGVPCYGSVYVEPDGPMHRFEFPNYRTSNEAEFGAVIAGLEVLAEQGETGPVLVRSDSKLVVFQCQGKWKARADNIRALKDQVRELAGCFEDVRFEWVPRREIEQVLDH